MKSSSGYIALISVIIICAVLLIITFTVSFSGFFARYNIFDSENKKISVGLAEACVDTAILEIAKGNDVPAGTTVTVGDSTKVCKICEVTGAAQKIIKAKAIYGKAYTNLTVAVTPNASDVTIDSWEEVPTNSSCVIP